MLKQESHFMRFGWRERYESRGSRTVLRGAGVKFLGLLTFHIISGPFLREEVSLRFKGQFKVFDDFVYVLGLTKAKIFKRAFLYKYYLLMPSRGKIFGIIFCQSELVSSIGIHYI